MKMKTITIKHLTNIPVEVRHTEAVGKIMINKLKVIMILTVKMKTITTNYAIPMMIIILKMKIITTNQLIPTCL